MPELDLSKEINIAIKAALSSGKHLKENKIELNKTSSSDPRDIKLADISKTFIRIKVISTERGKFKETTKALLKLPKSTIRTKKIKIIA